MANAYKMLSLLAIGLTLVLLSAGVMGLWLLKAHHRQLLPVVAPAMLPLIRSGDGLVVAPAGLDALQPGQFVSYRDPSTTVRGIGRVLTVDRSTDHATVKTTGSHDLSIDASQLGGRIVAVIPGAGTILTFLRRPTHLILALYLPAAIAVYYQCRQLAKHSRRHHYRLPGRHGSGIMNT